MLTIFLSIFLSKGCAQDQELSDVKVVYGANTRGYHRMITIENGTFSLVSQRDGKPSVVNLTDAQWKKLAELYSKIDEMPESIQKIVKPFMNIDKIKQIVLLLVILYLCSSLCTYIQSISMTDVANKFAKNLRSRISIKINKLPLKYFDKHQSGDT